eukprot:TRINITY_DN67800_c0_g1_i1.p1 TRINITY_DN67800_c0_g1~~TRINITY_DN67800_c0_g1_i1.p1  ORF type:complete len:1032 (+),score=97.84 TRINITY_DN67800_c0_g1_i1:160-3096(+)
MASRPGGRSDNDDFQQLVLGCNKDGMDYLRKGQYKQAFEQLKYAEAVLIAKQGEDEPTNLLAVTCNNLGCYYKKVGKLHAALSYLRKALKIEVSLQTDDVTVAGTHLNICAILSKLDKHDKAVQHASCALELISSRINSGAENVSQDEYSVLAIAYHNVAVERDFLHHWDLSAQAYQQGYQIAKKYLGEQHPLTQTLGKNSDAAAQKSQKFGRDRPAQPPHSAGVGATWQAPAKGGAVQASHHPLLPEIGGLGNRGKESSTGIRGKEPPTHSEESMPIPPGRNVHQEAEEWVQSEELNAAPNWRQPGPQLDRATPSARPAQPSFSSPRIEPPSSLGPAPPAHVRGMSLQAGVGAGAGCSGAYPELVGSIPELAQGGGSEPTERPWAQQPSFLDTIAHEIQTVQSSAPASPPPLVIMSREKQQQQLQRGRDDRPSDLVHDPLLDETQTPRPFRPPRQVGPSPSGTGNAPAIGGRPPRAPLRSTRAERELARTGALSSRGARDEVRDAGRTAPQSQLLRKTATEKLQRYWRAHWRFKQLTKDRKEKERLCATMVQARWRAFHVLRQKHNKAATMMQKIVRGFRVRVAARRRFAAIVLQRHAKGLLVRKQRHRQIGAILQIQKLVRGRRARKFAITHRDEVARATLVIQKLARVWKARRLAAERRKARRVKDARICAATTIQSVFRGRRDRRKAAKRKQAYLEEQARHAAATKVQALVRRDQAKKRADSMRHVKLMRFHRAATTIRKHWLRCVYRNRYLDLRSEFIQHEPSIITIQRYVRGYIVRLRMWRDAIRTEEELWAAVEIQRCWRGYQGRLRWELAFEAVWSREAAAHRIQRYVRGWLARTRVHRLRKRLARAEFLKARRRFKAAQRIQALVRGYQTYRRTMGIRRRRVQAAVRLQKVWRGHVLRCGLWRQVLYKRIVQIQALGRGFIIRNRRFRLIAKVILIQRQYRHWLHFIPEVERQRRLTNRRRRRLSSPES